MSLIQRAKSAWNAFMSRAPTEQTKKDEVNKSDERLA